MDGRYRRDARRAEPTVREVWVLAMIQFLIRISGWQDANDVELGFRHVFSSPRKIGEEPNDKRFHVRRLLSWAKRVLAGGWVSRPYAAGALPRACSGTLSEVSSACPGC